MTTDYETMCSEHARGNLRKMMKLNEDLIDVKSSNKVGGGGKTKVFLLQKTCIFLFPLYNKCIFLSPFCYPNIIG